MIESLSSQIMGLPSWGLAILVALVFVCLALLIKRVVLGRVTRLIDKTPYKWDTAFIRAFSAPLSIVVFVLTLIVFEQSLLVLEVEYAKAKPIMGVLSQLLVILAIVLFIDRFSASILENYATRSVTLQSSKGILRGVIRGVVIGLGLLILLSTMGISITPVLASLGIGSLAVALALQPTLENFFSGVQLVVDKPIRVGDFIELESGEQGFVERIGWRSTWIRMLPNNVVIMPNSALSQSKIINYFYPEKELSVPVDVGVHYDSDLEFVEQVTLEVAREILRTHKWGVPEYETFVVYHTFDNSSINFTVMLRTREYFNRFFIKSEFIKALHKRYAKENIVIPYPITAINVDQEKSVFRSEEMRPSLKNNEI